MTTLFSRCWMLLIFISCVAENLAEKIRYDGHQVFRAIPRSEADIQTLVDLGNLLGNQLDFWRHPSRVNHNVDFMTSPTNLTYVTRMLKRNGVHFQTMIENVQDLIDDEERSLRPQVFDYDNYNDFFSIYRWMTNMEDTYSNIATMKTFGWSYLNWPLSYLKVGSPGPDKPAILFHGGIHAREWISPATVIYMTKWMLEGYGTDRDITDMLNKYDFYIIPVFNVDGYGYSWTTDRFWRKTRRPNSGTSCVGTDPNRNWAVNHCGQGSSTNPCSSVYCGPYPFSEVEVKTVSELISSLRTRLKMHIDYHAYGQMWLTPYGYTTSPPSDYDDQYAAAEVAVDALRAVHGTNYIYGSVSTTIYVASGGSNDWVYDKAGVKYSFGLEGRDTGEYGFLLPANQIRPSAEENFAALKACIKYIEANP